MEENILFLPSSKIRYITHMGSLKCKSIVLCFFHIVCNAPNHNLRTIVYIYAYINMWERVVWFYKCLKCNCFEDWYGVGGEKTKRKKIMCLCFTLIFFPKKLILGTSHDWKLQPSFFFFFFLMPHGFCSQSVLMTKVSQFRSVVSYWLWLIYCCRHVFQHVKTSSLIFTYSLINT